MPRLAPLLLAYDGECSLCHRMMEWIRRRDRWCLVVAFPFQDPELVQVAPELAGRPLHVAIHGMDVHSREVFVGADLLPRVLARLPRWRWVAPLLRIPGMASTAQRGYEWVAARRHRLSGRASLRR